MAKSLALEVADQGITVNVVCPCTVATPMVLNESMYLLHGSTSNDPESEKVLERFRRVNPIPEPWLQPEDVTPRRHVPGDRSRGHHRVRDGGRTGVQRPHALTGTGALTGPYALTGQPVSGGRPRPRLDMGRDLYLCW